MYAGMALSQTFTICTVYMYLVHVTLELSRAHTPHTLHNFCHCSALALEHACATHLHCACKPYFYDLTTLTYELEHVQYTWHT